MTSYRVTFTKYDKAKAQRRNSGPTFFLADNWQGANRIASAMLDGMQSAMIGQDVEIASLQHEGLGGMHCTGSGVCIWFTSEEEHAYYAAKAEAAK